MNIPIITLLIITGVVAAGYGYQTYASQHDKCCFPSPGKLLDVGSHRLHLNIQGEADNKPTIILEAGMASYSANWAWVQQELAKETQVIAYDRAGLGWNEPGTLPLGANKSAREPHTALQNADCLAPYVLTGHSYGGLVVHMFADLYPDEVVGLVLVDASHPDQWMAIPASRGGQTVPQQYAEMRAYLARPEPWIVGADGLVAWRNLSRQQVNQAKPLDDLPLMVISVTEQAVFADDLTALQNELPKLSSNSQHLTVEGATHYTLVSEKKYADIVSNAIMKVVAGAQQITLKAETT